MILREVLWQLFIRSHLVLFVIILLFIGKVLT
jgi:hypothetical protein